MSEEMSQFIEKNFWGNSIGEWLVSFGIILGALLLGKFAYYCLQKIGKKLTAKTKTRVDDVIFDMIEEPASLMVTIYISWFGIGLLTLPEGLVKTLDNCFYFSLVLSLAWMVDRVAKALMDEIVVPMTEKTETDFDDQLLPIARKGLRAIIWAIAIIVGVDNAGYDIGAVLAGLGIGGLAFALAAQDTVSNLFGGVTIFVDQPFKINDRVQLDGLDGTIVEIGTRSTRLRTLEGRMVTIPNSRFTDQAVINVSSEPTRKVNVGIGLTYDTDAAGIEQALKILKNIVHSVDDVEDNHLAWFGEFGDFALGVTLIYYIKKESSITDTMTKINLRILKEFAEAGLDMAFPTQTLHHLIPDQGINLKKSA